MKTSFLFLASSALFAVLMFSGCVSMDESSQTSAPQIAVRPTSTPTPKPTPTPTLTKAERRKEARRKARAERQAKREKARAEARAKALVAYDVPALSGKSIEEISATLGPVEDPGPEDDDGEKSWSNRKGALLVHYDTSTRASTEFFVSDRLAQPQADQSTFLKMGNLREGDARYTLKFVPYGRALEGQNQEWMGVTVTPN